MGLAGRGCCEYAGMDPSNVDVSMGTFTKSFGGKGGYVAAAKRVVDMLLRECASSAYHTPSVPSLSTNYQSLSGEELIFSFIDI